MVPEAVLAYSKYHMGSYIWTPKDPGGERVGGPVCFTETIKGPRFHRNHQGGSLWVGEGYHTTPNIGDCLPANSHFGVLM